MRLSGPLSNGRILKNVQFRGVYKIFWRSKGGFARTPPAYGPVSPAKKQQKKPTPASESDSEFEQKNPTSTKRQGGLTIHKVQLNAAEVSTIEKGDCLQDVHIALANALLQQQFPGRAGFQSTLYVANGRCIPQKEGTIQIHFDEERKHWLTSSFSSR